MPKYLMPSPRTVSPDATTLDQSQGHALTALYGAAIGPVGTAYYLPVFARFETCGQFSPSWNWSAGFITLNWLIFRKLWTAALIYLTVMGGATFVVLIAGRLVFQLPDADQSALLLTLAIGSVLIPGVYGNALLHAVYQKKMAHALANTPTVPEACAQLRQQASTAGRRIAIAAANGTLAAIAVAIYLALPHRDSGPVTAPVRAPAATAPAQRATQGLLKPDLPTEKPTPATVASRAADTPAAVNPPDAKTPAQPAPAAPPASAVSLPTASVSSPMPPDTKAVPLHEFYINVGLFADGNNARNAQQKLHTEGLPVISQELATGQGPRTRVRVGPFRTRTAAEKAAGKIQTLKLEARIVQL